MDQVLLKAGQISVEDTPAPVNQEKRVLIEVMYSAISTGTEMATVSGTAVPLWKRALHQPKKVKKVIDGILDQGLNRMLSQVNQIVSAATPLGYSVAGEVVGVSSDIQNISVGDYVVAAGAQCAHHASVVSVPLNLVARVPDKLSLKYASTATLGAIALQGVRRAAPTLGECFIVQGLGLLGQLTVQLLIANGCRVLGVDYNPERLALAESFGAVVFSPGESLVSQVRQFTGGIGVDGAIVTAKSQSNAVLHQSFEMTRRKGRVVLVGDVGMSLNREDIYAKELDFYISCSYGPGRYDATYEEDGIDYPIAYVRWTENRNMQAYLQLLADQKVSLDPLITNVFDIQEAEKAYQTIKESGGREMLTILAYGSDMPNKFEPKVQVGQSLPIDSSQVQIGVVGPGGFAKSTLLPIIVSLKDKVNIRAIAGRHSAKTLDCAKHFSAQYATTDADKIFADDDIDAVFIATRHHLHADLVIEAIRANKHVFVEKPLAMNQDELSRIRQAIENHDYNGSILTGFNRRFAPGIRSLSSAVSARQDPLMVTYHMNAGYIPLDCWVYGPEGGGRNIGEACHIYDLFTHLTGAQVSDVVVRHCKPKTGYFSPYDNFSATVSFDDGSVCTLVYSAMGATKYPKEVMEVMCDGAVYRLDNYKVLEIYTGSKTVVQNFKSKGHHEELVTYFDHIRAGTGSPIPLWQQYQAMEIAFSVEAQMRC